MKSKIFYALSFLALTPSVYSQVGIGTKHPDKSAQLEVSATDKGVLIPRIALTSITQKLNTANDNAESLLIFNSSDFDENSQHYTKGYYYWDTALNGGQWVQLLKGGDLSSALGNVDLAGEVTGKLNATKVKQLFAKPLESNGTTVPTANQVLTFDGTNWTPAKVGINNIDKGTGTAGDVLTINDAGDAVKWGKLDGSNVNGKRLTLQGALVSTAAGNGQTIEGALLKAAGIKIKDKGIVTSMIDDDAVTPEKIAAPTGGVANKGKVLTVNEQGDGVEWKTPEALTADNITGGKTLSLSGGLVAADGTGAVADVLLKAAAIKIADEGITSTQLANDAVVEGKIADNAVVKDNIKNGAVTPEKIAAPTGGVADKGKVLTVKEDGTGAEWKTPEALTADNITGGQELTAGNGLTGTTAAALLKAATLSVVAGNGVTVDANGVSVKPKDQGGVTVDADGVSVMAGNGVTVDTDGVNLGGALTKDAEITTTAQHGLVVKGPDGQTKIKFENLPEDTTTDSQVLTVDANGTLKKKGTVGKVYKLNEETKTGDVWEVNGDKKEILQQTFEVTFDNDTEATIATLPDNITVIGATLQNKDQATKVEIYNSIEIENGKIAANIGISYYTLNGTYYATVQYFKNN